MSISKRLEAVGVVTAVVTGVAGTVISVVSLWEGRQLQDRADAAATRQYAAGVTYMVDVTADGPQGWRFKIKNYSDMPIQTVTISTATITRNLGTLAPCYEFDVTDWVAEHESDRLATAPDDPGHHVWVTFTDALGQRWHRGLNEGVRPGEAPKTETSRGEYLSQGDFGRASFVEGCST